MLKWVFLGLAMVKTPNLFTFRRGILRAGARVLPLPIAESWRTNVRVALAILNLYFEGEPNAERKAWAMHYRLSQFISTVTDGWSLQKSDLDDLVAEILCEHKTTIPVEIISAQRRDQIRLLSTSSN